MLAASTYLSSSTATTVATSSRRMPPPPGAEHHMPKLLDHSVESIDGEKRGGGEEEAKKRRVRKRRRATGEEPESQKGDDPRLFVRSGYTWRHVDQEMKEFYYHEFLKKYTWESGQKEEFKKIWNNYYQKLYKDLMYK